MSKRYFAGLAVIAAAVVGMLPERSDAQRRGVLRGGRNATASAAYMPYADNYTGPGFRSSGPQRDGYYYMPYADGYGGPGSSSAGQRAGGYYLASGRGPVVYYPDLPTYPTRNYPNPLTQGYQSNYPPAQQGAVQVVVRVPAAAEVWFDGTATQQRGTERLYFSPQLSSGRNYSYQVRARWNDNGQARDETRTVSVTPGQTITVDFTQPAKGETINPPEK